MTAKAQPNATPAAKRHHRNPNRGPKGESPIDPAMKAAWKRARTCSWSRAKAQAAATMKNTWNMSSMPNFAETNSTPSNTAITPANVATCQDCEIRRTSAMINNTVATPKSATDNRHPSGVYPKSISPKAISCLPSGGCTTSPYPGLASMPPRKGLNQERTMSQACGT